MTDNQSDKINLNLSGDRDDLNTGSSGFRPAQENQKSSIVPKSEVEEASDQEILLPEQELEVSEALRLAEENRDKWMRAVADFENYKKRSIQERSKLIKYKNEELLRDLLPVIDNLDRAISASSDKASDSLLEGVKMTVNMFKDVLGRFGVSAIESVGAVFNPQFQEAIATVKDPEKEPNVIVEELEKGYMYQDRLLRPAKVVVNSR
jgi:molecular chaperone GrpE